MSEFTISLTPTQLQDINSLMRSNGRPEYFNAATVTATYGSESVDKGFREIDADKLLIFAKRWGLLEKLKPMFGNKDVKTEIETKKRDRKVSIKKPVEVLVKEIEPKKL